MILGDKVANKQKLEKVEELAVELSLLIDRVVPANKIPGYVEANDEDLDVLYWLDHAVDEAVKNLFDAANRAYIALSVMAEKNLAAQKRAEQYRNER